MSDREQDGPVAVDFDGTLAYYERFKGDDVRGAAPIWPMVERVRAWIAEGREVVIFTARASHPGFSEDAKRYIQDWAEQYIGKRLEVTAVKSWRFAEFWDDRAVQVETNTGRILGRSRLTPWAPAHFEETSNG